MSNLLRRGKRVTKRKIDKAVKQHFKAIRSIKRELNGVAIQIYKNDKFNYTTEDIGKYIKKYTDLEIGDYEKLLVLSRLVSLEENK